MKTRILALLDSPRATLPLALAALAVRLVCLAGAWNLDLKSDAASYDLMARSLLSGEAFDPYWPPGLPLLLAGAHALLGAGPAAARAVMLLPWALLALSLFLILRRTAGLRAANLSLAAFALVPGHVWHAVSPLTPMLTAALLATGLLLALSLLERPDWGRAAGLGLCLGALVLTRSSAVLVALALPAYLWRRTRRIAAPLLSLLILVAVVGAWQIEARRLTGRWFFVNTSSVQNLFYGNNRWTPLYRTWWFGSHRSVEEGVPAEFLALKDHARAQDPAVRDAIFMAEARDHLLARPDLFLLRTLNRARAFLAFDTFTGAYLKRAHGLGRLPALAVVAADAAAYLVLMGLGLLALFLPAGPPDWKRLAAGMAVLYALPYAVSFSHPTYHFPVLPLLALPGLALLARTEGAAGLRRELALLTPRRRRVLGACLLLFALIQVEWVIVNWRAG